MSAGRRNMEMTRREFLKTTAVAGSAFVMGFYFPEKSRAAAPVAAKPLVPNAYIQLSEDNAVTFFVGQAEMGQNTYTTLSMCLADEMDADWQKVTIESAPVAPAFNHLWAPMQITGGSSSIYTHQNTMRKAGASMREMLLNAAAKKWNVPLSKLTTKDSMVINKTNGKSMPYGDLVAAISAMDVPQNPKLKAPEELNLIGKPVRRHPKEAWEKVTGKAEFGIDVRVKGQKYAAMLHPAIHGAKIRSFDASVALERPGVLKAKQTPFGIAIIADHWWQAKEALGYLKVTWDEGAFANMSTDDQRKQYRTMMEKPGLPGRKDGDTAKAFKSAAKIIEAEYEFPFLAHAAMEPLNCTVHHDGDKATIWTGGQMQTFYRNTCAQVLGLKPENVTYHNTYLGGAFGRRAVPNQDYILDAIHAAKGEPWPVMTLWTRESDIKMGNYRPMYVNKARIALDKEGMITAIEDKVAGQSIMANTVFAGMIQNGIDPTQTEGLTNHPYKIPNNDFQVYTPESPIPVLWWRSVGHTHSAPVIEDLVDQAARAADMDPFDYRRKILTNARFITLMEDVEKLSGWKSRKKEKNVGYGMAFVESFHSLVAQVAKVRIMGDDFKVEKVWCSVDCGFAFNPLNVENQMMGGIQYGLDPLKYSEITINNGQSVQSNFHDYLVTHMSDAPDVEVSIVNSGENPGGIGEPGTPPILPAVMNALFDATGKRFHTMPIRLS